MNIIILDFETSGLNPYHDDIIEIGAKVYNTDNSFDMLIKPKSNNAISENIKNITGITNKMLLEQGTQWNKGYKLFIEWMNKNYSDEVDNFIVSHNGDNFDFILFRRIINDLGYKLNNYIYIDTLNLSRRLIPNRYSYAQRSLLKTYNINNISEHRALGDVIALEKLFNVIKDELECINININMYRDYCNYLI